MNWLLFWYSQAVCLQCPSLCLKRDVTNRGLETCNEARAGRGALRCGARSRTAPQLEGGKGTGGEGKRPAFVLDGATSHPKIRIPNAESWACPLSDQRNRSQG